MKSVNFVTPVGRVSFPHIMKPDTGREYSDGKYKLTLLFDNNEDLGKLKEVCRAAISEKWGSKKDVKKLHLPFRDGNEKTMDGYKDKIYVTLKSNFKPEVVDQERKSVNAATIYGGCYARVSGVAFAYEQNGGGVSLCLNNIQFARDGEPFGNRVSASEEFDALDSTAKEPERE